MTQGDRTSFVDALTRWLTLPESTPTARRVAALIAADIFLDESADIAGWRNQNQGTLRRNLSRLGATFDLSPLGNVFVHTHGWLKEADRLNAGGRAGELAFLTLMSMGFETSGMCRDRDGKGFREVIARGEQYLRANPRTSIATEVSFFMGEAYADIVFLAAGGGDEYAQAADYAPEADEARRRALESFTVAMREGSGSEEARRVWPTIWRLAAGLAPARSYFFCIYD